ncbi:MAG: cob(I)yrinic acid a,c-diamide adenosyltransferase [Fermentimonas sp.]|jgi:cob(I)alamin adenosyltransferase
MQNRGYIQVYTGNGKGKTTAALGLTLRAVGAGKKVFFAQFVKGQRYSEVKAIEQYLPDVQIKQYGLDCFIWKKPTRADIDTAQEGLREVEEIILSGKYDVVILDEANIAVFLRALFGAGIDQCCNAKTNRYRDHHYRQVCRTRVD